MINFLPFRRINFPRSSLGATVAGAVLLGAASGIFAQTTATWGGGAGLWSSRTRWQPLRPEYPNGNYIAVLNFGTPTLDVPVSLTGLSINGGTIVANSPLSTVNASLLSGSITGPRAVTFNGAVTIGGTAAPNPIYNFTLDGGGLKTFAGSTMMGSADTFSDLLVTGGTTLRNTGSFLQQAEGGGYTSNIYLGTGSNISASMLHNSAEGTFTARIAAGAIGTFYADNHPYFGFQNAGVFIKTGTGDYKLSAPFANTGSVNVQAGALFLTGGGGGPSGATGSFTGQSGSLLSFSGGTFNLDSGSSVSSAGVVEIAGGAAVHLSSGASFAASGVKLRGGGILKGEAGVTFDGTTDIQGDFTMAGIGLKTFAGSTTLGGPKSYGTLHLNSGTTVVNTGNFLMEANLGSEGSPTGIHFNKDSWTAPTLLRNAPGATFTANIGAGVGGGAGPGIYSNPESVFDNAGSFVKTGAGEFSVRVPFINTGTVALKAGSLTLYGDGTAGTKGDFTAENGTLLSLIGAFNFDSGASVISTGGVRVAGSEFDLNPGSAFTTDSADISAGVLKVNPGAFFAANTVRINRGTLNLNNGSAHIFTGSVLGGSGSLVSGSRTILGGTTDFGNNFFLRGGGEKILAGTTTLADTGTSGALHISGTTVENIGSFLQGAEGEGPAYKTRISFHHENEEMPSVLRNASAGTFTAAIRAGADGYAAPFDSNSGGSFENAGTFVKSGTGNYTVSVPFANTGTVNVQAGGLFLSGGGGAEASTGHFTGENGSMLSFDGTFDLDRGASISSQGTVQVAGGAFNLNAGSGFSTIRAEISGGVLNVNAGASFAAAALNITGGTLNLLSGSSFVSAGEIKVAAGGSLTVQSPFTQSNTGLLGGTGTIKAPEFTLSGVLSPGASPGILTLDGDVNLLAVAVLQFELGDPVGVNDFLAITGSLTLDGTLDISPFAGFAPGFYDLITFTGTITDNGLEFGRTPAGFNGSIGILGNTVRLDVVAVPEPTTGLMAVAAAGFLKLRRRRTGK